MTFPNPNSIACLKSLWSIKDKPELNHGNPERIWEEEKPTTWRKKLGKDQEDPDGRCTQ